jgi:Ser-tRNA(Ala) deacylase AlaX
MNTELLYMTRGDLLEYSTTVQEVQGRTLLILPSTIFYPQGGGQPYDKGIIKAKNGTFRVDEVRNIDGVVSHIGVLEGEIRVGDEVLCQVDTERRLLNTRVHSAAHLVDMAVHRAGYKWIPGKGYSFPDGPYVEYSGDIANVDQQKAKQDIETMCQQLIEEDLPVTIEFMSREEMVKRLLYVPDYLPTDRPARVVFMGDYGIPCGGTHVKNLKEIGTVTVRKIKIGESTLKVSYQL